MVLNLQALAFMQAPDCNQIVETEVSGYGATTVSKAQGLGEALAEAMAAAITGVQGSFVSVKRELVDYLQDIAVNETRSITEGSDFSETFLTQFAGLITAYDILSSSEADGILTLTIQASVCVDPRIALVSSGPAVMTDAFAASLENDVRDAGWRVVPIQGYSGDLSQEEMLEIGLQTGATYVAVSDIYAQYEGVWRELANWSLTLNSLIYDVRGLNLAESFTLTQTSVGMTDTDAQQQGATALGDALAGELTRRFLADEQKLKGEFRFTNNKRAGTQHDIENILLGTRGITDITASDYDPQTSVVVVTVALSSELCTVAGEVAKDRSLLTNLQRCEAGVAVLEVIRE